MRRNDVRDYLLEFMENDLPDVPVQREMEVRPKKSLINTITGPRRAGKTFYFYQKMREVGKEKALYLNFEDIRLMNVDFRDIREILRIYSELSNSPPVYIFMDEIQNIEGWEHAVRNLYERQEYSIFLTGSSSKLLSREIATELRGRSISHLLLPFSFSEFLRAQGLEINTPVSGDKEAKIRNQLLNYLKYGGFPQIVFEEKMKDRLLSEFAETMLYRDIVERHGIRSINLAKILLGHMMAGYGREFSINSTYNFLKSQSVRVSKDTVYTYASYFLDSLSLFFLNRYSEKVRYRESWPKKIYLSDTGFARTTGKNTETGRLMENAVFLHLKRLQNMYNIRIFYYKNGGEVDFLILKDGRVETLIQVTYSMQDADVRRREIRPLLAASKRFGTKSLLIVTWDEEATERIGEKEIRMIPLWKFLLESGSWPSEQRKN